MRKISLPIQIGIGMLAGFIVATLHIALQWNTPFVLHYIKPIGQTFIRILKALCIPLVVTGIIQGTSGMGNAKKLASIGIKTLVLYVFTTFLAVCIGLFIGLAVQPGKKFSSAIQQKLAAQYEQHQGVLSTTKIVKEHKELVPDNLFKAFTENNNLLFIVLFALLFALALLGIDERKRKIVVEFYDAINEVFREIIKLLMYASPLGIFSLTYALLVEQVQGNNMAGIYDFLTGVGWYTATVICGLCFMNFGIYPLLAWIFTKTSWKRFVKGVQKAQIVALTTSSSPAALPTSIECAEKHLGVKRSIANFVLSIGATINMDGTVLYQAIATLFIAQAYNIPLAAGKLVTIAIYLTISSFGIGGVPSASLGVTSVLLGLLGIPPEGIMLIIMPDMMLDRGRTTVNITSDQLVGLIIDRVDKKRLAKIVLDK